MDVCVSMCASKGCVCVSMLVKGNISWGVEVVTPLGWPLTVVRRSDSVWKTVSLGRAVGKQASLAIQSAFVAVAAVLLQTPWINPSCGCAETRAFSDLSHSYAMCGITPLVLLYLLDFAYFTSNSNIKSVDYFHLSLFLVIRVPKTDLHFFVITSPGKAKIPLCSLKGDLIP